MPIDPFFTGLAAAGVASAADIAGGFFSRPDQSQRDLMWEGEKIGRSNYYWKQAEDIKLSRRLPSIQMDALRRAGLNPILGYTKGQLPQANTQFNASSAPQPYTDPMGAAVSRAGNSAVKAFAVANEIEKMRAETKNIIETNRQIRATTENIAANTDYVSAKAVSERENVGLITLQQELTSAKTDLERQNLQKQIIETAISKEDLTVAEKDAVVAAIDIDMYSSTVGEVSRWLEKLGISPQAAVGMAHMLWSYMRTKGRRK